MDARRPEALTVRHIPRKLKKDPSDPPDLSDLTDQERWALYAPWLEHRHSAVRANAAICLIHQTNYLLDQQLRRLEQDFLKEGGLRERMTRARLAARAQQSQK